MNETTDLMTETNAKPEKYASMVLLVDDQMMIGEAIRRALLGQPNIELHYCGNPARALEVADRIRPTVILQDLVMPDIDGLELVRQYRANPSTKNIPIIVLSTKEEAAIKSDAFAAGANDYLVKLPDNIELIARIRYHSKGYLVQLQRDEAYRALRESQQELLEKNLELARLTNVDGLTGLNNRRYFNEFAKIQWKHAIRKHSWVSVLMIDVDDFKRYNDTYGHLAGDEVLMTVGDMIKKCVQRPTDLAARFGGEEFVVILPDALVGAGLAIGKEMCRSVEHMNIPHSGSTAGRVITVSVGLAAAIPQRGDTLVALIEAADRALYGAKHAGKNRVVASKQETRITATLDVVRH
jgi:two-component system chemotaxis family response regulator WspR